MTEPDKTMQKHILMDSWDMYKQRLEYWNNVVSDMTMDEAYDRLPTWEEKLGLHKLMNIIIEQELSKEYSDYVEV